jgi:nucleoside-diphosphate-sugar epimerase/sterol desaturase/sphingolipid hydroxylase (fatty acid hydroxylase superfamily)
MADILLALDAHLLSPTPVFLLQAGASLLAAFELLSWGTVLVQERLNLPQLSPGGPLVHRRDIYDFSFILINKLVTLPFVYHAYLYLRSSPLPPATALTVLAPVLPLFLAYDLLYAPFHYFLHWAPVYPYIHKHHHRQVAPHRGADDAVNTHPIEYAVGMWQHLGAVWVLQRAGVPVHPAAVLLFVLGGALVAAANHTRHHSAVPLLYDSADHDTHHRFSAHNYAQYAQLWDALMHCFQTWRPPPALGSRAPPPAAAPLAPAPCPLPRDAPSACVVTGGNGLVGAALVRALAARGASRVLSLDLAPPQKDAPPFPACVQHLVADVCDEAALAAAFAGADAVFHVAAAVGPFFPHATYERVNHRGTEAVVAACRAARVPLLVVTSSPTIKLNWSADVVNVAEDALAPPPDHAHLHEYSRSKAAGTRAALAAHCETLRVCAIAPHQVYGKEDRLFLPALLEAAGRGSLRIFGPGDNLISMCAAENAAHAHILAAAALARGAKGVGGEFFIVSDTGATYLWDTSAWRGRGLPLGTSRAPRPFLTPRSLPPPPPQLTLR